jgi:hypothetical protein
VFQFICKFLCARYFHQSSHSYLLCMSNTNPSSWHHWSVHNHLLNTTTTGYCAPIPATLRPHLLGITTIPAGLPFNQSSHHVHPHLQETACFPTWLLLLDCLTLRMKALQFFKMLGNTQRHNVEFYRGSNFWVLYFESGCLVALEKERSSSVFRIEYSDLVTYFRVKLVP